MLQLIATSNFQSVIDPIIPNRGTLPDDTMSQVRKNGKNV